MTDEPVRSTDEPDRNGKVERLIAEYELADLGADLERHWTATGTDQKSLRELAEFFNKRILQAELQRAGRQVVAGEPDTIYQLLAAEGPETADRTRVKRRLERDGIDTDDLVSKFVSYQTIRRYLTNTRNVDYTGPESPQLDRVADQLQRLKTRTTRVTETKVEQLRAADTLQISPEFRTTVDIHVYCPDCETRFELGELLKTGGCGCAP